MISLVEPGGMNISANEISCIVNVGLFHLKVWGDEEEWKVF